MSGGTGLPIIGTVTEGFGCEGANLDCMNLAVDEPLPGVEDQLAGVIP
jgi:hypothetical protein